MPCAVILTSTPVEYIAATRYLSELKEEAYYRDTICERGKFSDNGQEWDVGIVETSAGNSLAAIEVEKAIAYFKPHIILFVGVAGRIKNDIKLGDVVVATKVYGYESDKVTNWLFKLKPDVGLSTYSAIQWARTEAQKTDWLARLSSSEKPNIFVKPIVAGEKVISNTRSDLFQFLQNNYGDALAVEIEGRNILQAAYANRRVPVLIIRGIADLIDNQSKRDEREERKLAAHHASTFAFEVLAKFKVNENKQQSFYPNNLRKNLEILGKVYYSQGDYERAIFSYEESLKIAQKIQDRPGEEIALACLGTLYANLDRPIYAIEYFQQSLAISQKLNDLSTQGKYLENLGEAYYILEDYTTALDYFQKSLVIREEEKDYQGQGTILQNLGLTYEALQDYKARDYYAQSFAIAKKIQNSAMEFNALSSLGDVYSFLGMNSKAMICYQRCMEIIQKLQRQEEGKNTEPSIKFREALLEFKTKITEIEKGNQPNTENANIVPMLPSSKSILEKISMNSNKVKSIKPRSKRSQYRAVLNWLTKYKNNANSPNFEQIKGLLETFFHLCKIEDWQRSKIILFMQLNTPTLEELHIQLGTWGYYNLQINCCSKLLDKLDEITNSICLNNMGNAYSALSKFSKSLEYYNRDLKIEETNKNRQQEGITWNNIGNAYSSLSNYPKAIECCQKALSLAQETNDWKNQSDTLGTLGSIYNTLGEYSKAIKYHEKALTIKQEINDIKGEGMALSGLGCTHRNLGNYHEAVKYHEQHLEIASSTGDIEAEAHAWGNLGNVYDDLSDYCQAIDCHKKQLEIARAIKSLLLEENALANLGLAHLSLGNYEQVIQHQNQALRIAREIQDVEGESNILGNLGLAYYSIGEYSKAIEYHLLHLNIAREIGSQHNEANALGNIGNTYYFMEEYEKALDYARQHLLLSQKLKNPRGETTALNNLGNAYDALGNMYKAIEMYRKSLEIARKIGHLKGEAETLCNLGTTIIQSQKYSEAIKYLEAALDIVQKTGERHVEAITLYNLAEVYQKLKDKNNSQKFAEQALQIANELDLPDVRDYQELRKKC